MSVGIACGLKPSASTENLPGQFRQLYVDCSMFECGSTGLEAIHCHVKLHANPTMLCNVRVEVNIARYFLFLK